MVSFIVFVSFLCLQVKVKSHSKLVNFWQHFDELYGDLKVVFYVNRWMAYLMPDGAAIFFDSRLNHTPHRRENFLPEWMPIRLLPNGNIVLD
jgi:hypothetical protein